ncbi:hypothetical protein BH24PSE2_BH24PSE2_03820 [soil metagenome]
MLKLWGLMGTLMGTFLIKLMGTFLIKIDEVALRRLF